MVIVVVTFIVAAITVAITVVVLFAVVMITTTTKINSTDADHGIYFYFILFTLQMSEFTEMRTMLQLLMKRCFN